MRVSDAVAGSYLVSKAVSGGSRTAGAPAMLTTVAQRWKLRRDSYRPARETIRTIEYEIDEMRDDGPAKAFVQRHHYSASYPAARFRFALRHRAELVGVAVFSHPCSDRVLTTVFPGPATDSAELGRFVLLDRVPANGESWFLARCFELLRGRVIGVLSFSDPAARQAADGRTVFAGHVGTIYQAGNAVYLGRAGRRTIRLLPDGRVFSARAAQKIRAVDRGWRYSADMLIEAGAPPPVGSPGDWLRTWLPRVTRPIRHPGNHRYAFALERTVRRSLPTSLPYPKLGSFPLAPGQHLGRS
jgi:hypothetical protein